MNKTNPMIAVIFKHLVRRSLKEEKSRLQHFDHNTRLAFSIITYIHITVSLHIDIKIF